MKKLYDNLSLKAKGAILTLLISLTVLFCFFGNILREPNKYYFDRSGDGLLAYYYATYQLKYDSTYAHLGASNYPHGESVFFSSDQTVITAGLRFINNFVNVEDKIPAIFNLLMLLSFPICALFVFLVLFELRVNFLFAALWAVGVAFLSPQWVRIQAHFPLSYAFAIPALFYFLIRFNRAPTFKKSIAIGLLTLCMICLHAYFLGMFGIVLLVYYFIEFLTSKRKIRTLLVSLGHFFIQLVLPFLLLQAMIYSSSDVTDRTTHPWGFLVYLSSFDGMFFPYGLPYQEFFSNFNTPEAVTQYEGISYVGLAALLLACIFILKRVSKLAEYRFRELFSFPADRTLWVFIISGILGAIYACGIPYVYNEELVHYIGPLRQMRGLGRFAWLLFYSLNIFAAWYFYGATTRIKRKWLQMIFCILPLTILYYDAYYHMSPINAIVSNRIPVLEDKENTMAANKWVKELKANEYQAIIPLPYFLQGSENLVREPENNGIFAYTYIASMKTGLPITAAVLSRTSLQQAYENMALILEPYRPLEFVKHLPNKKPFLILAREQDIKDLMQLDLLGKSQLVVKAPDFNLYHLKYETLVAYSDSLYALMHREYTAQQLHPVAGWMSSQPAINFAYRSFDETRSASPYRGAGAYEGEIKAYNRLFEDSIPAAGDGQNYVLSFWVKDFNKDLLPRSTLEVTFIDPVTGQSDGGFWTSLLPNLRTIDREWALIEKTITLPKGKDKVSVTVWNQNFIDSTKLVVDELWLRPEYTSLYKLFPGEIFKNNRYYLKK